MQYWAFCANPKIYDINRAIREVATDTWRVDRGHGHSDVKRGDRAIIWKSLGGSKQRGIVALAEVLSDPESCVCANPQYYQDDAARREGMKKQPRVRLRYVVLESLPIWLHGQDETLNGLLEDLSVSKKGSQGTVFVVTPKQWAAIIAALKCWPSPESLLVQDIVASAVGHHRRGQGFQSDIEKRLATERHAMQVAIDHYTSLGWSVQDASLTCCYDLLCTNDSHETLYIEVKGTTGDGSDVLLTPNEVDHARKYPTDLFIVSHIGVVNGQAVSSGPPRVICQWCPTLDGMKPIAYSYRLPSATP